MSVKATVTIELDGVKHEMSMDDARDLWIALGNVLNPVKKETPKDPAPKQPTIGSIDDIRKLFPVKDVPIKPYEYPYQKRPAWPDPKWPGYSDILC